MPRPKYSALQGQTFAEGNYHIVPYREEDMFLILKWRNEQMDYLRQNERIPAAEQRIYFFKTIQPTYAQHKPPMLLFSYLLGEELIGYGGLVHIDWEYQRAEVSFLLDTRRAGNPQIYETEFTIFLRLMKRLAFGTLGFHRLTTECFDLRAHHIRIIEQAGFRHEGRLREQVQALEAAKSRFFVNLSHEFRTPLTLLIGPLEDARAGRYGALSDTLRRRLPDMLTQAFRLNDLIDQLLDLSKLEAGSMPLQAREGDLAAFTRQRAELFRSAADRAGVTLLVETPERPRPLLFDPEKVERIVFNLLSNALAHTPAGGTVRVRVDRRDGADRTDLRTQRRGP